MLRKLVFCLLCMQNFLVCYFLWLRKCYNVYQAPFSFFLEHRVESHLSASSEVRWHRGVWVEVIYTTSRLGPKTSCVIFILFFLLWPDTKDPVEGSKPERLWRYWMQGTGFMMSVVSSLPADLPLDSDLSKK